MIICRRGHGRADSLNGQKYYTSELPEPSVSERAAIDISHGQRSHRLPRVRANLRQSGKSLEMSPPHSDVAGWQARLQNALGTSSREFCDTELARLATVLRDREGNLDI